jgi:integrase
MRTGETKWRSFCQRIGRPSVRVLPERAGSSLESTEEDLLCFIAWLARSHASTTVAQYFGHVKALAAKQIGKVSLAKAGIRFDQADLAVRILKARRPPTSKPKVPFTLTHLRRLWKAIRPKHEAADFSARALWAVCTLAFQQLLRLNEVVDTGKQSAASLHPFRVRSLSFLAASGATVPKPTSRRDARARMGSAVAAALRMVPSKADQAGKNPPLQLAQAPGSEVHLSPCWALWQLQAAFPRSPSAPLIPNYPGSIAQMSNKTFQKAFRSACQRARIRHSQFGLSAFRVGGASRLQEIGAGEAEIQAAGRWSSEAWRIYVRQAPAKGAAWSAKMLEE